MNLPRPALVSAFHAFVEEGHGVLLGAPGVGKSHLLRELADDLLSRQAPCLFLPVDRMPVESEADLRHELGATGDLISFLREEADDRHGALVIDALDAVRSDRPRLFVLNLARRVIAELSDSWTVVLSMRTYDALHSVELEALFPPDGVDDPENRFRVEGAGCRHFCVPPLDDAEVDRAAGDLPWLRTLWQAEHEDLRRLLRVPLNLWLLERLIEQGVAVEELSPVHSEVQLLDLFWRQRVESGPLAPDKQLLVTRAAENMVASRTLWARRQEIYVPATNQAWQALHSSEVLLGVNHAETRVSFAHNVLFDYAVSVEVLDDTPASVVEFLRNEPDRALFLRPTLDLFFARAWFNERPLFWETFWTLLDATEPHVRLVAQVLPPGLIARETRSPIDLAPVLDRLDTGGPHAENAVVRILQAIRTLQVGNDSVWAGFAARAAQQPSPVYFWELARLLSEILTREDATPEPNADVRSDVASAARSLLCDALASRDAGALHAGAVWLIDVVARTYSVAAPEARSILEEILASLGDPRVPIDLYYRLADALQHFWHEDPELAAATYRALFAHRELSEEPTRMGGVVIALTSNRRQDFGMARYVLTQNASRFVREEPSVAVPALTQAAVAAAMTDEHLAISHSTEFEFGGQRVSYWPDHSHIWDSGGGRESDAEKLIAAVLGYLAEADGDRLSEAITAMATVGGPAFVWRALLRAGALAPERLGNLLMDLLLATPVLSHAETAPEAAALLAAAADQMDDATLQRIESAIVQLSQADDERLHHWARRLIAQIPEDRLGTNAARELRASAHGDQEAFSNQPLFSISSSSRPYEADDWLRDEGVDPDQPTHRELLSATEGLEAFAARWVNEREIPPEEAASSIELLRHAHALLAEAGSESLPAPLLDTAWARIGDAAAVAARTEVLAEPDLALLREVLLACAGGEAPRATEDSEASFTMPAWSPAARNAAGRGILRLIQKGENGKLLDELGALAGDPVPSVRYLTMSELERLVPRQEAAFWALARGCAERETNRVILQALGHALTAVASREREALVAQTLSLILRRMPLPELARSRGNEDQIGQLVVGLAVVRDNVWAGQILASTVADAPPSYLSTVAFHLMGYVDHRHAALNEHQDSARAALRSLNATISRVERDLREELQRAQAEGGGHDSDRIRELFEIVDVVVSRLYFESGVYVGGDAPGATPDQVCAFFNLVRPLLLQIGEMAGGDDGLGLPAHTAHYFIELLRGSLSCAPAEVLHLTRLAIDGSRGAGYAFDPMAAQEVTAIVETTLADHRETARSGQPLDDLTHVLDAFVEAGWPEAQRLVWRLEDLFR